MSQLRLLCVFIFSTVLGAASGQVAYPQDYFRSPMDTTLLLSAPFGQLRDNHFHSGIDIRTFEKEGLPVYAVADGWVSRIKISAFGYGKAIYIDHPNGYTSVYAHLSKLNDSIGAYTKHEQYRKETFEVDLFPKKNLLPVKKGEIIAFTGNSGGSTGPHLHFEIRHTKTEYPINPLLFNLPVPDTAAPFFKSFTVYNLMPNRPVPILQQRLFSGKLLSTPNGYRFADTLDLPAGVIGFGVEAFDYISDKEREQNVYTLKLQIDSVPYFRMDIESFAFSDTKYINAHIDYERFMKDRTRIQKCFIDDGNRISIYKNLPSKGRYMLADTLTHLVRFTAKDAHGKYVDLELLIRGKSNDYLTAFYLPECSYDKFIPHRDNIFQMYGMRIEVPRGALYDTMDFCIKTLPASKKTLSRIYALGDPGTPLHSNMSVSIKPDKKDTALFDKMIIGRAFDKGGVGAVGGGYNRGWVTATSRVFGDFAILVDTIPPKATLKGISRDSICTDTTALRIIISDNLSGIAEYRLTINGKWVLADYDAKNDLLTYEFDATTSRRQKLIAELIVIDRKDNITHLKKDIYIR
jgi:hypothetical protein